MAEAARNAAETVYQRATPEQQRMAWEFFNSMDTDRNGVVSFDEFSKAVRQRGLQRFAVRDFFNLLDTNGDGTLDFYEILALYLICPSQEYFREAVKDLLAACATGTILNHVAAIASSCSII